MARRSISPSGSKKPKGGLPEAADKLFACLYHPAFSVWAALQANPLLLSAPLIIHRKGVVFEACQQAVDRGVRTGWANGRAQAMCPEARLIPFDIEQTAAAWDSMLAELYGITPCIEPLRPGVAFLEPPRALDGLAVLSRLTGHYGASVGIAGDRASAELSARFTTLGTVARVRLEREQQFLGKIPVKALQEAGLSESLLERLQWFGYANVSDLQRLSREQIASQFGEMTNGKEGQRLWYFARAGTAKADRQPVQTYQVSPIRKGRFAFSQAATSPREWEPALWDITQQASGQLNGLGAGCVSVALETNCGHLEYSRLMRETVSKPRVLFDAARKLIQQNVSLFREVQVLEIRLSRLDTCGKQMCLFDDSRYDTSGRLRCPPRLKNAIQNIEARYRQSVGRWRVRDEYATVPDEVFEYVPILSIENLAS